MPRFQVILTDADDQRFAAYCSQTGHKKSTLTAKLIRDYLDSAGFAYQPELLPASPRTPRQDRKERP